MYKFASFKELLRKLYTRTVIYISFYIRSRLVKSEQDQLIVYKPTMKVLMTYWIINWIIILDITHLKMGYKNLIQIATTEMDDILLREINELCPISKQPNSVHIVQYNHDTLTSIRLRIQRDMIYNRLGPKLVCKI